jgi:hypothetical protein
MISKVNSLGHLSPDVCLHLGGVEHLLVTQHSHQVGHLHLRLIRRDQAQPYHMRRRGRYYSVLQLPQQ